jgi:hypothetical protein
MLYVEKINKGKEHNQGVLMCAITLAKYLAQQGTAPHRTQSRLCEQGHGSFWAYCKPNSIAWCKNIQDFSLLKKPMTIILVITL